MSMLTDDAYENCGQCGKAIDPLEFKDNEGICDECFFNEAYVDVDDDFDYYDEEDEDDDE